MCAFSHTGLKPEILEARETERKFQVFLEFNNITFPSLCSQRSLEKAEQSASLVQPLVSVKGKLMTKYVVLGSLGKLVSCTILPFLLSIFLSGL